MWKKAGTFGSDHASQISLCDACVHDKQHKVKFPISASPNVSSCSNILEYVHVDVWGHASVPTQCGNKYFLSIIDDFLRNFWVFLMKNTYDVYMHFKN